MLVVMDGFDLAFRSVEVTRGVTDDTLRLSSIGAVVRKDVTRRVLKSIVLVLFVVL